jgi:hypothetical protein
MTPTETVRLTKYVHALCPQQAIDEFTADAWHDLLAPLTMGEARAAVVAVTRRQPFCAPSEILAEVARARGRARPHSGACRVGNHRDCLASWCNCSCHPAAVEALVSAMPSLPGAPADDALQDPGMPPGHRPASEQAKAAAAAEARRALNGRTT